ncbi:MAG: DUF2298 domain-containing protein [Chloroflexi bacterium]|nr:DUF2298 domain-containing protein [Chloroflexota bacterium]MCI0730942.1 DUF2298 domain-containing protein [Chloroflexota bacterium]
MPLTDIFAAIRWWIVLMVLGAAAMPLSFRLFGRLPDRGYAFSKMLGLLVTSYLFWLLGSLGFLGNNLGGILFALAGLVVLSVWVARRSAAEGSRDNAPVNALESAPGSVPESREADADQRTRQDNSQHESLSQWLREQWRYVLAAELVFAAVFVLWVWVRAQNPAVINTEKPMEFAFLNAVGRSPSFPPLDPWLSGYAISYYYFGYIMTSVMARLAAVPEPLAFNLGIAWLTAGTALGAFGLVYNLVAYGDTVRSSVNRWALTFGLVAAVALPLAGNLEIVLEVLHANGLGSDGFWAWLDVRDLSGPAQDVAAPRYTTSEWWWWRSSRVIHEYHLSGRSEEGLEPIAEFPAFSFALGDMHPHVLALPFAFLSLAIAFQFWILDFGFWIGDSNLKSKIQNLKWDHWLLWGVAALVLGGLSFLNTWDVLIHLFIVVGAFALAWRRQIGRWERPIFGQALLLAAALAIPAILLYLPFYLGFRTQAGPPFLLPMTMQPTRLTHFVIIFGMPLLGILFLVVTLVIHRLRQPAREEEQPAVAWQTGLLAAGGLVIILFLLMLLLGWIITANPEGAGRMAGLANELAMTLPAQPAADAPPLARLGWGASAVVALLPAFLRARLATPALTLFLTGLLALVVALLTGGWSARRPEEVDIEAETAPADGAVQDAPGAMPFVLLLILTGVLLTLGPEFVYIKDVFSQRLNTIFKFYYQAWVLFGVAALFGLAYLMRHFHRSGLLATAGYGLALAAALLFPVYAVNSRAIEYRGPATAEERRPATLNGLTYLSPDEYEAIMWLRQNVGDAPVIVEAVGGAYTGYARVSASTGLPTVLGWPGHEYQWRGSTPEPAAREPAVQTIYSLAGWQQTAELLNRYQVAYVYFGPLEQTTYDPQAAQKFEENLEVAYRNGSVTIYRWQPQEEG